MTDPTTPERSPARNGKSVLVIPTSEVDEIDDPNDPDFDDWEPLEEGEALDILEMRMDAPSEILEAIADARQEFAGRRVVVLFQPFGTSLNTSLRDQLVASLSVADVLIVTEPDNASQNDSAATPMSIVENATARNPELTGAFLADPQDVPSTLDAMVQPGDVVLMIGMGSFEDQPMTFAQQWLEGGFDLETDGDGDNDGADKAQ